MFTKNEFSGFGEESVKHDGIAVKIVQDDCDFSPREWDNLGTIATWHRRYNLGDVQPKCSPIEYMTELAAEYNLKIYDIVEWYENEYYQRATENMELGSKEWLQKIAEIEQIIEDRVLQEFDKYYISLPVYMYDHSGITISSGGFSCPWDSGQLGFIYVSKEDIRTEYGYKHITKKRTEQIVGYLNGEIDTYDQYLRGDIWGFQIGNYDVYGEFNHMDSCFGFYGREYAISEAIDIANNIIAEKVTA